jgi:hypothetical protein
MRWALAMIALAPLAAGCGLNVQSPDLFLLTRTGQGAKLTMLVNDGGTISCNGHTPRRLPGPLLLDARDLAGSLDGDAKAKLRIPFAPNSVYHYTIRLQNGTISFPDTATAGGRFPALARAELFTVQAAQQACGITR